MVKATRVLFAAPRRGPLLATGLVVAAVAYVATVDPYRPGRYPLCPLLAVTGLYCAACGGLRAVHDLARLDVASAWDMNPLLVLALPLIAVGWARWLGRSGQGGRRRSIVADRRSSTLAWVVLVVILAYSVLRNVAAFAPGLAP